MENNNFDWVKPYNDSGDEIIEGAGYLSGSTGYPLNWKLEDKNFGRLIKRATYQFTTNSTVYTGIGSKNNITKTATLQQHGQAIFDIQEFDQSVINNTIVFNLAGGSSISGAISISKAFTNAQYFEISITRGESDATWEQSGNIFAQVDWIDDNNSSDYFNSVREETYYRFIVDRPGYYGGSNTYQENDVQTGQRESYRFDMMYENNDIKISTGNYEDIVEYFEDASDVTSIDINSLNSANLTFTDNNGTTRTFKDYYNNLLIAGERDKFNFLFYTNVNSEVKNDNAFDLFRNQESTYYIAPDKMLYFTITITPYGYKQKLNDIQYNSPLWNYSQYKIKVYIINCVLNPYLYLHSDGQDTNYVSGLLNANGGTDSMPVFSNRGWDITTQGSTEYIGYNQE